MQPTTRSNSILRRYCRLAQPYFLVLGLVITYCGLSGCSGGSKVPFDLTNATYVGRDSCVDCHQEEAKKYAGSHHDKAMDLATAETVLGDFNEATVEHHGIVSRMYHKGEKYFVNTEGPDGQMTDFEVKYVFGVKPLQQYMIEFPSDEHSGNNDSVPRVQVLRLCWDTEKNEWFYLPPPDVAEKLEPDDDLHWTGIAQRWNNMCAECHSTDYQKNFSPPTSNSRFVSTNTKESTLATGHYNSTFMEIDVSCEACHGPGSVHIELSKQWLPGWNRQRGYGLANLKATAENQIQACAPCHSRRSVISGGFKAGDDYYDYYSNQLLTAGIYYPDGQVLDEDYVHGSFIQSKMYHKGIKCSDCHDPHSAKLKHSGNEVCTSCHQHPTAKYDTVAHHFHKPDSDAAQCVNCHMPATTYMAVDSRRDHSFRIPRPDLSTNLGTPNACTGCHLNLNNVSVEKHDQLSLYQDWMSAARGGDQEVQAELARVNQWCDDACEKWYGENRRRDDHFGIAIAAGQANEANAVELLQRVLSRRGYEAPAIGRATALQVLAGVNPSVAADEAERALDDEHPLVRSTALNALAGSKSPTKSVALIEKALKDPRRTVRTEAARNLLEYPANMWNENSGSAFRNALTELSQGLEYNNDRAGAHLALGILAEQQGRDQQAMRHYETAIAVEPNVNGPRTNLAALLERNLGSQVSSTSNAAGELEQQIKRLRSEELVLLERDVKLLPESAAIQYRFGLALYVAGEKERAVEHLVLAAELEPDQPAYAQATAMLYETLKNWEQALKWGEVALKASGNDPQYVLLLQRIRSAAGEQ